MQGSSLRPPRLLSRLPSFGAVHDTADPEGRHATWLELFFDLVFVAAIANLGVLLHDDSSLAGVARFFGLMITLWWAWISFSYFADLFDDDSATHRAGQLLAMFGAVVLAVTLSEGVADDGHVYAVAYAGMFALLAVMYALTGAADPRGAELCRWYTVGSGVGAGLWALSALVPTPGRYAVWAFALLANMTISGPLAYARMRNPPMQLSHMPERFGLFTIVVLGEAVLAVVRGISTTDWDTASTVTAAAGFVIAAGIWWVYFEAFDEAVINQAIAGGRLSQVRSFLYGYGHVLIYAAIVGIGVGVEVAVATAAHGGQAPPLLGWSIAALIAGFFVVYQGTQDPRSSPLLYVKTGLAVLSIGVCSFAVPVTTAIVIIAAAWVVLIVLETRVGVREEPPAA